MSRDGSGNYSLPEAPFVFDTVISETAVNSNFSDIAAALTQSRSKDGQTIPTANQNYGGYKHTNINTSAGSSSRSEYVAAAVAQDGAIWDAGTTGGTSTAYTATLAPAITAYADKQCFRVKFNAACGANPTINFNAVGAKKIYANISGTATQLASGDVPANYIGILRYDTALDSASGGFWLLNGPASNIGWDQLSDTIFDETPAAPAMLDKVPFGDASDSDNKKVGTLDSMIGLLAGHLYGCTLSNNVSDANNDIDIAAGVAVDNTNFVAMRLASAITKRLDASWAVGTNQGGLDTGSKANSTWYYVWIIQRSDTGVVDALFSTSTTSPTMPANYDRKRRVGAVRTDGSGNLLAFTQLGDEFLWKSPPLDVNTSSLSTSSTNFTLTVPGGTGLQVWAEIQFNCDPSGILVYLRNGDVNDEAPSDSAAPLASNTAAALGGGGATIGQTKKIRCSTSSQIAARADTASSTLRVATLGWWDTRGRDSGV
jgi:hypothetical protein